MQIYKRVALLGAIANPNVGDEAILSANLQMIHNMYGENCKIYIFTKDSSYTSLYNSESGQIVPVDYIHRITVHNSYDIQQMVQCQEELLNYTPQTQPLNTLYETLHNIFKEIDILHIIGGGYLNSLWPDMLYETLTAARMAKKYSKKYIITGIGIYPINEKYKPLLLELCRDAEFVDFRDNSALGLCDDFSLNYSVTLDDAVYLNDYYLNVSDEKYANILIHDWNKFTETMLDKIKTILFPFMQRCIEDGSVTRFYILGFSEGDFALWEQVCCPENLIKYVDYENFIVQNCVKAKHKIANAKFNIGSRFHMAVFSLSSSVPILSIYYDDYYKNKLESIHQLYNSKSLYSMQDITHEILNDFVYNLDEISRTTDKKQSDVLQKYIKKCKFISAAYGINDVDKEHLFLKLTGNFKAPKISVIIPIFNMDAYLRNCLDSVSCQTLKDIEILCINDGSTDYTQMILNEYAWKDKRIKIISQTNHGVAYARNIGIERATGEFLYFLDPDDWLPDEKVFSDMYYAAKKSNMLVCGGTFKEYAARGIIDQWEGNLCKYSFEKEGVIKYSNYQFDYGWVRFIYNREFIVYNNLRIPSLKFFEDPVFFVRVMHQAKYFYCMTRCTYCYRTGHKSSELSYEKVVDLIKGLYENIQFAIDHNYNDLISLELARIEDDYAGLIVPHLLKHDNTELRQMFEKLNQLLYMDNDRIEYRMYNKIISNKDFVIWQKINVNNALQQDINNMQAELQKTKETFYSSRTWKLGNKILYIPKKIKHLIKGGN